ncbi:LysR family transcriptional regulator [Nannocystis punicea]|uniref:LysR family transcriptional regulator n=1 Tax=Nannocystis punicea TaxID=2995304 RepID=A0ABY7HGP6_9BACT|nr:LysR family transcriptional regulator [Nannocystis poenicansa]WAS98064.1 LysR family transcriptional regulator [Nannocystis poenicansa]
MAERNDASDIEVFVAVARAASFTRAAEQLGTSKSNVGKAVQRLEARLGTRLLQRTTRAVRLTEDGETYFQAARAAVEGLREAEQALAARRSEPAGRVRVDLPAAFGRLLLPAFGELRQRHPKLSLELSFADRMSDPVGEGWDLVVRIGELARDTTLTARKLGTLRLGLYASPAYLARRGRPADDAELLTHDAIVFRGPSGQLRAWAMGREQVTPTPTIILTDGQALVDAALQGLGVAQIFDKVAEPHVTAGRLERVLPGTEAQGPPIHALVAAGPKMPPKTRAVLDALVRALGRK